VHPGEEADIKMEDGGVFEVADVALEVIHAPGHSPGSVCLYCEGLEAVFTGDVLTATGPVARDDGFPDFSRQLSSIGAQAGRLSFEAGRVIREVRSGVNRRLNAETANLRRTAAAGVLQLESINALEADPARWQRLPPALREAAALRARHPDDDLAQLAARAGCSRPAMAGRLHRLVAAAGEAGDRVEAAR